MARRVTRSAVKRQENGALVPNNLPVSIVSDGEETEIYVLPEEMQRVRRKGRRRTKSKSTPPVRHRRDCPVQLKDTSEAVSSQSRRKTSRKTTKSRGAQNTLRKSIVNNSLVNILDSEDEMDTLHPSGEYEQALEARVKNFLGVMLSSDDEDLPVTTKKENAKISQSNFGRSADFYVLTDSDDETSKPNNNESVISISDSFVCLPSTSSSDGIINVQNFQPSSSNNISIVNDADDIDCLTDDIINLCDENHRVVEKPPESINELKMKTNSIFNSVSSMFPEIFNTTEATKPEETSTKEVPKKPPAPLCPICLEEIGGDLTMMSTICGHVFCKPCLTHEAKNSKRCPTCRTHVTLNKIHPLYL